MTPADIEARNKAEGTQGYRGWSRDALAGREPSMWRYRELMPLFDGEAPVSLGEGWTPLIHAQRLGATLGLPQLFIKDESLNPTNSFKARGQSAAITRASRIWDLRRGVTVRSPPSRIAKRVMRCF